MKRKKKICRVCHQEKYIFARGMCEYCYRAAQRPIRRRSLFGWGNVPPKERKPLRRAKMRPRSDKRVEQEREYAKLRKIVIAEQYNCFFCGEKFKKNYRPDIHHLKGRDNELLTDKRYLVAVHRKCHREYHDKSRCKIDWFPRYLMRLKQKDFDLWRHEIWISEK